MSDAVDHAPRETLEQVREALFSLEQINAAYRNRIAELEAVNTIMRRIAAAHNRNDAFADVFSASRGLLAFDDALVALPCGDGELRLRAATSTTSIGFELNNILRKVLAGRTLTTTAERLFSRMEQAGFSGSSSVLCLPIMVEGETGIFAMIRCADKKPFGSTDVETGQHIAVLITQALAQMAKQEAQAQNRAKSAFLATMSHELRTPLNGVIGMTSVLEATGLSDEQRHCVETIETCGNSLLRLIDDILEFARADSGELSLAQEIVEPENAVRETSKIVAFQAQQKGLEFSVDIEPGVPAEIAGDGRRVRQVLLNFLQNAVKFTSAGSITVKVEASGSQARPMVHFAVTDTGIGVPDSAKAFLFRDFYQVDASRTRRFGGTGLGLAISRRIVERLGGKIGFDSTIGAGSTFWFEIPVGDPDRLSAAREKDQACSAGAHTRPLSILVAEDSPMNQNVARLMLEKLGHTVALADNGAQAVERCTAETYDLILMDMQMPEMDGLQATRTIRAAPPPARDVPIIALTANAFEADVQACLTAGMNGYVSKPVNRRKLEDAIASVQQSRSCTAAA